MQYELVSVFLLIYIKLSSLFQDGDAPEFQKKVLLCFRIMARWFADPAKAEENFQILEQFKDSNIWKILETLLDPKSSLRQACACRVRNECRCKVILSLSFWLDLPWFLNG